MSVGALRRNEQALRWLRGLAYAAVTATALSKMSFQPGSVAMAIAVAVGVTSLFAPGAAILIAIVALSLPLLAANFLVGVGLPGHRIRIRTVSGPEQWTCVPAHRACVRWCCIRSGVGSGRDCRVPARCIRGCRHRDTGMCRARGRRTGLGARPHWNRVRGRCRTWARVVRQCTCEPARRSAGSEQP